MMNSLMTWVLPLRCQQLEVETMFEDEDGVETLGKDKVETLGEDGVETLGKDGVETLGEDGVESMGEGEVGGCHDHIKESGGLW